MTDSGLKILMTGDNVGGVWTYCLQLSEALRKHDVTVFLATMGEPLDEKQKKEAEKVANLVHYHRPYKLEWMEDPWEDIEEASVWIQEISREVNPDIIHLNNYCFGDLPWDKPVIMVFHSCVNTWFKSVQDMPAPAEEWGDYTRRVTSGLQGADVVVGPTSAILEQAKEIYGPFRKHSVIYNGLAPSDFRTGQKEEFIFTMGRIWDEAKNIDMLLENAKELSWPVYVAGEAKHPVTGETKSAENVHFLGKLPAEEIKDWLGKAPVYALPVKYEPFGLTFLEAGNSGCALVGGNTDTLKEIWKDTAIYTDPDDPGTLIKKLNTLCKSRILRQEMAVKANKTARKFTSQKQAESYFFLYNKLLTQSGETEELLNISSI